MTDHVTPEEARRPTADRLQALRDYYVGDVDGAGDVEDLFAEIDSLAAQLEAAQAQLREAQEMAWEACGERDAAQEVIEAAMEAKTWEACYEILERARYDAAREA